MGLDMVTFSKERTELIEFDPNLPPGALSFDHIAFLDFDGVLHPEGCGDDMYFMFLDNLCKVIRDADPAGEMPIVISSMWRFDETIEQLRAHFPEDIGRQIVGVTPNIVFPKPVGWESGTTWVQGSRQREIEKWLSVYAPCADWLAIDDRSTGFDIGCPSLFLVPDVYEEDGGGISDTVAVDLRNRLTSFLWNAAPVSRPRP